MNDQEKETAAYPTPGCAASSRIRSALASFPGVKSLRFLRPLGFLGLCGLAIGGALGVDWPILGLSEAVEKALNRHASIGAAEARLESTQGLLTAGPHSSKSHFRFPVGKLALWTVTGIPAVARSGRVCLRFTTN